ncbi:hypothetical protein AU468_14405 [Alkalispirochaeta sphaeroplastigenens]|uniref:Urease accessory protein UreH-like transmembrane domain-containing protein n=1 Tax=Alkalispirochaeta sphaeroplastigenens TaxID=1187066 RepID=A0A2S4JFC1_9SPIO|nr:sulfite exporter TauE/SafE family protein [Alkalispirochaeta sphaeroplastigenens]POQ98145.1 hypothetical protein AU468_14405 [Alkalispirochaeta sphaeroplastigenens]
MLWSSYLSGLILGLGICSLHCSLVLAPLVAHLHSTWRGGVRTALLFSLGKTIALTVYGGLAVLMGFLVYDIFHHRWITFAAGMVVALLGIWFLLYSGRCGCLMRGGSPLVLGLVDGAVPCAATSGFLLFLATRGGSPLLGMAGGFLFGLGTATGPALLICGLAPSLWRRLAGNSRARLILRVAGSSILFLWAILLLAGAGL